MNSTSLRSVLGAAMTAGACWYFGLLTPVLCGAATLAGQILVHGGYAGMQSCVGLKDKNLISQKEVDSETNKKIQEISSFSLNNDHIDRRELNSGMYTSETDVSDLEHRISSSKVVINFNGQYLSEILKGYKHWSELESTSNTKDLPNLLQRLESERNLFGTRWYNENILKKIDQFFKKDKANLISEWNKRFETNYKETEIENASMLLEKTGFKKVKNGVEYGVVFGCLHDNSDHLIQGPNTEIDQEYMRTTYGKSQIIVDLDTLDQSNIPVTAALGDTFDASPESCAWRNNRDKEAYPASSMLFPISKDSRSNNENIRNRIKTQPADFPYIEAHIFTGNLNKNHMKKIRLSKSEYLSVKSNTEASLAKLMSANKGKIELID